MRQCKSTQPSFTSWASWFCWQLFNFETCCTVTSGCRSSVEHGKAWGQGGGLLAGHPDPAPRLCHCCKPSFPKAVALESHCFPRKHYTANHQFKLAMNFGKKRVWKLVFSCSSTLHQQYGLESDLSLFSTLAHSVMWRPNKSIWTCYITIKF